jgi:hypothetical protein
MIIFKHKGNFNNTERFLNRARKTNYLHILQRYAREGVTALALATPVDTGLTSKSWDSKVDVSNRGFSISWTNSNVVSGVPIAIILQYGHGTKNGGYVQGRDYINPAIRPIFDKIADEAWKEVNNE